VDHDLFVSIEAALLYVAVALRVSGHFVVGKSSLDPSKPGILTLGTLSPGTLEPGKPGETWNLGNVVKCSQPYNLEILGTLEVCHPWDPGTLQSWNLGSLSCKLATFESCNLRTFLETLEPSNPFNEPSPCPRLSDPHRFRSYDSYPIHTQTCIVM
jgi:hypothetical protein